MFILAICASRERYFRNNGWTRSKVEKVNKACNLETHESPPRSNISHKKIHGPQKKTVFQLRLGLALVADSHWFKFKPKLSNATVNLLSPYDLQDKPKHRNSKNAFFR